MWDFEHQYVTAAAAEDIWRLYADPSGWPSWDDGIEEVVLDGPFVAGAAGTLRPTGQPALPFRLVEVSPYASFTDETELPGAILRFRHRLDRMPDGGTRITHRVEFEGPAGDGIGSAMGPELAAGIPASVTALAAQALAAGTTR